MANGWAHVVVGHVCRSGVDEFCVVGQVTWQQCRLNVRGWRMRIFNLRGWQISGACIERLAQVSTESRMECAGSLSGATWTATTPTALTQQLVQLRIDATALWQPCVSCSQPSHCGAGRAVPAAQATCASWSRPLRQAPQTKLTCGCPPESVQP